MSIETGVVLDYNWNVIYWHLPLGRSGGYLPDSRDLWNVIWENRENVMAVAHSHPEGIIEPSGTDITTFAAIEAGLGKLLLWPILTGSEVAIYKKFNKLDNVHKLVCYANDEYFNAARDFLFNTPGFSWVHELREKSNYESLGYLSHGK